MTAASSVGRSIGGGRTTGCERSCGRQVDGASLVLPLRLEDLLELHRGMVLYLGSLVPDSALTEKEAGHMLTHTSTHWLPFPLYTPHLTAVQKHPG